MASAAAPYTAKSGWLTKQGAPPAGANEAAWSARVKAQRAAAAEEAALGAAEAGRQGDGSGGGGGGDGGGGKGPTWSQRMQAEKQRARLLR